MIPVTPKQRLPYGSAQVSSGNHFFMPQAFPGVERSPCKGAPAVMASPLSMIRGQPQQRSKNPRSPAFFPRPRLTQGRSQPLISQIRTPDSNMVLSVANNTVVDGTATAPARVPGREHGQKRKHDDDNGEELSEEQQYRRILREREKEESHNAAATSAVKTKSANLARKISAPAIIEIEDTDEASSPRKSVPIVNKSKAKTVGAAKKPVLSATRKSVPIRNLKEQRELKKQREEERIELEERWREKYARAFPGFKIYLDVPDTSLRSQMVSRALKLGARIEDFFSSSVTHFITDKAVPTREELSAEDKENAPNTTSFSFMPATGGNLLRSPIKLRTSKYDPTICKAVRFDMKIWNTSKISLILERLEAQKADITLGSPTKSITSTSFKKRKEDALPTPDLSYFLSKERETGLTQERDPEAIRPDYIYFNKGSYWVTVEDLDGIHAPIIVKEYAPWKPPKPFKGLRSKLSKRSRYSESIEEDNVEDKGPPWPPLRDQVGKAKSDWAYDTPDAVDEEDAAPHEAEEEEEAEGDVEEEDESEYVRIQPYLQPGHEDDFEPAADAHQGSESFATPAMRRAASMHEIGHVDDSRGSMPPPAPAPSYAKLDLHLDQYEGKDLRSKDYMAASGNSVTITSHINSTTSFAAHGRHSMNYAPLVSAPRNQQLGRRLHHQVLTRRTAGGGAGGVENPYLIQKQGVGIGMGGRPRTLRKSKSTTTMRGGGKAERQGKTARHPQREETKRPGYCENCRIRFDDFSSHVKSRKHTRWADNADFTALDDILECLDFEYMSEFHAENGYFDDEDDFADNDNDNDNDMDVTYREDMTVEPSAIWPAAFEHNDSVPDSMHNNIVSGNDSMHDEDKVVSGNDFEWTQEESKGNDYEWTQEESFQNSEAMNNAFEPAYQYTD